MKKAREERSETSTGAARNGAPEARVPQAPPAPRAIGEEIANALNRGEDPTGQSHAPPARMSEEEFADMERVFHTWPTANAKGMRLLAEARRARKSEVKWIKDATALSDARDADEAEIAALRATRAGKLLARGEPFFVVKATEPYAESVALLIRETEQFKKTWTPEDETLFEQMLGAGWIKRAETTRTGSRLRADKADAENERLRGAILWALGEGLVDDFPDRPSGAGAYWWRTELRRRAALAARGEEK